MLPINALKNETSSLDSLCMFLVYMDSKKYI